jgi:hypothetical protein
MPRTRAAQKSPIMSKLDQDLTKLIEDHWILIDRERTQIHSKVVSYVDTHSVEDFRETV